MSLDTVKVIRLIRANHPSSVLPRHILGLGVGVSDQV